MFIPGCILIIFGSRLNLRFGSKSSLFFLFAVINNTCRSLSFVSNHIKSRIILDYSTLFLGWSKLERSFSLLCEVDFCSLWLVVLSINVFLSPKIHSNKVCQLLCETKTPLPLISLF